MQREKFHDAEQMWLWFMYSKQARRFARTPGRTSRPCELIDVETLVTKLYLAGRLNDEHLGVMAKYGERHHAPNPNIFQQSRDAELWSAAMQIISDAAIRVGWIESKGGAL